MKRITISDTTLKQKESKSLTFRQRLELVKFLDRLGTDVIEIPPLANMREDSLFIKSVSESVKNASICVCSTNPSKEETDTLYNLTGKALKRRMQIALPVSSVQMEYFFHKKAESMLSLIKESVSYAKSLPGWEVELLLKDAGRAEMSVLKKAEEEGADADIITICDDDSAFMPQNIVPFLKEVISGGFPSHRYAVQITNNLHLADVNSIYALEAGVSEIKTQCVSPFFASTENIVRILSGKSEELGCDTSVNTIEISRIMSLINKMYMPERDARTPFEDGVRDKTSNAVFTLSDTREDIAREIRALGYELSEEEFETVFKVFKDVAKKKASVHTRDLEAIIASSAMQITPTYTLDYFIINAGNTISATSHVRMKRSGEILEEVSVGDGPIDASFLAIEKITGRHYELDDFQIQTVTEGREAMGEAIVKLRANGRVYSGRGVSTDIIGSSIMAYVNALNKIEYDNKENAV